MRTVIRAFIGLFIIVLLMTGCGRSRPIYDSIEQLEAWPSVYKYAPWSGPIRGKMAEEMALVVRDGDKISFRIRISIETFVLDGRLCSTETRYYDDVPYFFSMRGGIWGVVDPIEDSKRLVDFDAADIEAVCYGSLTNDRSTVEGLWIRDPVYIAELFELIRKRSYSHCFVEEKREIITPAEENDGYRWGGGSRSYPVHGCSQAIFIYYEGSDRQDAISGHVSNGGWGWVIDWNSDDSKRPPYFYNNDIFDFLKEVANRTGQKPPVD